MLAPQPFAHAVHCGGKAGDFCLVACGAPRSDLFWSKRVIVLSLVAIITLGVPLLLTGDTRCSGYRGWHWVCLSDRWSRPIARPWHDWRPSRFRADVGLFALSGKITAFVGPLLFAWLTAAFHSQRAGMAGAVVLVAVGLGYCCRCVCRVVAPPARERWRGSGGVSG